jgi:multiple sugar transport system substrate-binding protein
MILGGQEGMNAKWKWLKTSLLVILALVIIVGCSNSSSTSDTEEPAQETEEAATDTQPAEEPAKAPEDYVGTITWWGWNGLPDLMREAFNKKYPNIQIEATVVAQGDMAQKIKTALAAGEKLPDIFEIEVGWKGEFMQMDIFEDLTQPPYNYNPDDFFDYVNKGNTNIFGKIVGVETSIVPAGVAYKRDLAKQYFGTDDPAELEKMFTSWDDFITKGKEVLSKSGGKVKMFAGLSDVNIIITGQKQVPLTDDADVVQVSAKAQENFALLEKFRDAGVVDKLEMWTAPWNASYAEKNVIFYPAASWSGPYVIGANDKDSTNWGLIVPPGGAFSWGGTIDVIPADNSPEQKELAWKFLEFALINKDTISQLKSIMFYPAFKSAYEDPAVFSDKAPLWGGQDAGEFYTQIAAPQINFDGLKYTPYDSTYNALAAAALQSMVADSSITSGKALENLIKEMKAAFPDAEVK